MASLNSLTLPKLPGSKTSSLRSRKNLSTRFNHEELVGVKCRWKRECLAIQASTCRCLCVA